MFYLIVACMYITKAINDDNHIHIRNHTLDCNGSRSREIKQKRTQSIYKNTKQNENTLALSNSSSMAIYDNKALQSI